MYDDTNRRRRLLDLEARFPPREAIRQLFLSFTSRVSTRGAMRGCLLTNTALELAARDPEAGRIVEDAQREIQAFFARMIDRGKNACDIPATVPTAETASGLLASLVGVTVLSRSRPEPDLLKAIVSDAMRRLGVRGNS